MGSGSAVLPGKALIVILPCLLIWPFALSSAQSVSSPRSQEIFPGKSWAHASVAIEAGWSKEKLAAVRTYADSIQCSAAMIVQGGAVVDTWGDIDKKIDAYSVRKSLISALYGIHSA